MYEFAQVTHTSVVKEERHTEVNRNDDSEKSGQEDDRTQNTAETLLAM